ESNIAGVGKINHGGEKRDGGKLFFAACCQHACGAAQDRTADAEAECMNFVDACYFAYDVDRPQRTEGKIIIPGQMADLRYRAAPGNQEHVMALRNRIFDK